MNYRVIYSEKNDCYYGQYQSRLFGIKMWFYFNHIDKYTGVLKNNRKLYSNELFWLFLPLMIITIIPIIFLCVDLFDDGSWREKYNYESYVLHDIEQEKIKEVTIYKPNKVVGVYIGDEYIDGARLERMKKLERIVEEK